MSRHVPGLERRKERRRGKDLILRVLSVMGVIGWFLMLVALFVADRAKPKQIEFMMNNLDRGSSSVRLGWNDQLLYYVFVLMVLGFLISAIGLYLNSMRARRRHDSYRVHLIFLFIISTIGIIYYLV
ncbi:MAG: hypothetical protein HUJ29_12850 [Gammaproteobacteria bacterium]|nr:hypothetical protein [Gammaproteobacteria bacterium]